MDRKKRCNMTEDEERLQKYIEAWNAQADGWNQWPELDWEEKCIWVMNNPWIGWGIEKWERVRVTLEKAETDEK